MGALLAQSCLIEQKRFALCASHFSLNGKEALFNSRMAGQSNQKKAALRRARRWSRRVRKRAGNFRKALPAPTETAHILVRRPFGVYPPRLPRLTGSEGNIYGESS